MICYIDNPFIAGLNVMKTSEQGSQWSANGFILFDGDRNTDHQNVNN